MQRNNSYVYGEFRKGRGTIYSILCIKAEVRKAQVNKETVAAVFFFNVEKVYNMQWRDGLLMKMHLMGIKGKVFH